MKLNSLVGIPQHKQIKKYIMSFSNKTKKNKTSLVNCFVGECAEFAVIGESSTLGW